jgi:hypothetical protein
MFCWRLDPTSSDFYDGGHRSVEILIERGQIRQNKPVSAMILVLMNGLDPIFRAMEHQQRRGSRGMNRNGWA